jgi:hypothetical protein
MAELKDERQELEHAFDPFKYLPRRTASTSFSEAFAETIKYGALPDVDDVPPRGYDLTVGPNPRTTEKTTTDDVGTHGDAPESAPNDDVGTTGGSSLRSQVEERPKGPPARSLSTILAGFKSAATKRINQHRGTPGAPVWHADSGRHKVY